MQRVYRPLAGFVLLSAAVLALLGAFVLTGWALHNNTLITVLPGRAQMKANTALGMLLLGLGLGAAMVPAAWSKTLSRALAIATIVVAGITLLEYFTGITLPLDELVFRDPLQHAFPGRMSPISAISFVVAGTSLALVRSKGALCVLSQALAAVVAVVAFSAIVGSSYGVPLLYGAEKYTAMALHTGAGFLLLAAGLLLAPEASGAGRLLVAPERGSRVLRRSLLAVIAVPIFLGWALLRPQVSFGYPVLAMALFAVAVTFASVTGLAMMAVMLNRSDRSDAEVALLREQSAAAIAQSERELRLITDQLPTLLSYIDAEGRFMRVNRTYEQWLGVPAPAIVGQTVRELLGDVYWCSTEAARVSAARGETVTFETEYPTLQGPRRAQITYAPDMDERGRLRGIACLVLDVDLRYKAELALRQSEKLAAVGRLASSIAHEINNPLEAMTNLLYLAADEASPEEEKQQFVAQAQDQLGRVTHIVTQTLRFHRQATGPGLCRLSELAAQVLELYQGRLLQKGIAVETRFRESAPLLCREGEVRQVIANLVGNALDALSGGRLLVRTRCATDLVSGRRGVCLTVADTGHGISGATREKLFEPFHTTKGETGSGLGLWISKEIVERHGGRMTVRSRVGGGVGSGTVFRVFVAAEAGE